MIVYVILQHTDHSGSLLESVHSTYMQAEAAIKEYRKDCPWPIVFSIARRRVDEVYQ